MRCVICSTYCGPATRAGKRGEKARRPHRNPASATSTASSRTVAARSTHHAHHGGRPPVAAARVALTVFRIVQEALTNARKHAGHGAHVDVELTRTVHEVRVTVTDDGPRPGHFVARGTGHGLVGMRERVVLHGGTLRVGPASGGFAVRASLPLPADRQESYT
ncbi:ATP-binding protein [Streptomyces sp. SS52]|uniref:sensor histidine kinase n=1 Tax=Streptomyces sp. SS52 TaxID=2563602 RepID=UPI001FF9928C|nr:ATP-binding protein [Streptomyces sp. SS52]